MKVKIIITINLNLNLKKFNFNSAANFDLYFQIIFTQMGKRTPFKDITK